MIRADHPKLTVARLADFSKSQQAPLRREAVRSLAQRGDDGSQQVLRQLASDASLPNNLRADAIAGLTHSAGSDASRPLLFDLLKDESLRREALRALRGAAEKPEVAGQVIDWWAKTISKAAQPTEQERELSAQVGRIGQGQKELEARLKPVVGLAGPRPTNLMDWQKVLTTAGDADAGERLFYHPKGPACFACHRVNGRGGSVGPDLSKIGAAANRDKIIESILQPSKEIAPQFATYVVETKAGQVFTGVVVAEDPRGELVLADAQGKLIRVKMADIEERKQLPTSIMPDNVHDLMTAAELRDLIAFLGGLK
jgi:putative heme-binding domain-containing protein